MDLIAEVFDDRPCQLGEGPLWHPEREQLFWFDITAGRLLSRVEDRPLEWLFDEMVSAAGWVDRETLLIASESALFRFDLTTGARDDIVALEADNPANRSNDGRADPHGGFWIGTMGKAAEPGAGAIYRWCRGELRLLHADITIPNSICFAPDGRRAYFADTATHRIMTQTVDDQGWPDAAPEVFADLTAEALHPDGAVIDAEGALWSAQWGRARVARYLPNGSLERDISLPGHHTSCPAFGGSDFASMFVTTAREGLASPGPQEGLTYRVILDATGLPEPRVIL
ncbi:MAG: SMP-30/gluconolactonase/LRE family protein [Pseudomonadota bacterium]